MYRIHSNDRYKRLIIIYFMYLRKTSNYYTCFKLLYDLIFIIFNDKDLSIDNDIRSF